MRDRDGQKQVLTASATHPNEHLCGAAISCSAFLAAGLPRTSCLEEDACLTFEATCDT
jgi:hypothetical protein